MMIATRPRKLSALATVVLAGSLVVPLGGVAVAGTGSSPGGEITLTKTADQTSLPPGGGSVTYTYSVTNNTSGRLFFTSIEDDKCGNVSNQSGLVAELNWLLIPTGRYYTRPGRTAVWECTSTVTSDTVNTAVVEYYDNAGAVFTATATETVTIAVPTVGNTSCDNIWSGNLNTASGSAGSFAEWNNFAGGYPIYNAGSGMSSSSAIAIDPLSPNTGYATIRSLSQFSSYLYRIDLATGDWVRLDSSYNTTAWASNRLAVDTNGVVWSVTNAGEFYSYDPATGVTTFRGTPSAFTTDTGQTYLLSQLGSGDIVFDGLGNMWIIAAGADPGDGSPIPTYLLTVPQSELLGGTPIEMTFVGAVTGQVSGSFFNGVAFDTSGVLYGSTYVRNGDGTYSSQLYVIDSASGLATLSSSLYTGGQFAADLASCAVPVPTLKVQKVGTPDAVREGDEITYTITVENLGNLAATGVTFQDTVPVGTSFVSSTLNGSPVVGDWSAERPIYGAAAGGKEGLLPGGDVATIEITVRVDDPLAAGVESVENQGSVDFTGVSTPILTDDPTVPGGEDPTVTGILRPSVSIVKSSSTDEVVGVGDVTYTMTVTNTGNDVLSGVAVGDPQCSGVSLVDDGDGDAVLSPGEVWLYECSLTLDAGVVGLGDFVNTATVDASDSFGGPVSDSSDAVVTVVDPAPGIALVKTVDREDAQPGETVTYTFVVTNTGNTPLVPSLSDPDCGPLVRDPAVTATELGAGESWSYTCERVVQAGDGVFVNTATVTGVDGFPSTPDVEATDTATVTELTPSVSLVKSADKAEALPGETVTYTLTVVNDGPVAYTPVVADPGCVGLEQVSGPVGVLAPGESAVWECTRVMAVGDAGGAFTNTATVTGDDGVAVTVDAEDEDSAVVNVVSPAPGVSVDKVTQGVDGPRVAVGDMVEWTYTVTNTGNTPLVNVVVTDSDGSLSVSCPETVLAVDASMTCTATGVAAAGDYANTGTVTADPSGDGSAPMDGVDGVSADDDSSYFGAEPSIAVDKLVNGVDGPVTYEAGTELVYTYVVTNDGNVPLSGVTVTDSETGVTVSCPAADLAPGESMTCTATVIAAVEGETATEATATGEGPETVSVDSGSPATIPGESVEATDGVVVIAQTPSLSIVKTINGQDADSAPGVDLAGVDGAVEFVVTNTGSAPLVNVTVVDDTINDVTCPTTDLAPGESMTCTATVVAPEPGVQHTNTATSGGDAVFSDGTVSVESAPDSANAYTAPAPSVTIEEDINGQDAPEVAPGSDMDVTYTVTNTGNTTLTIAVGDSETNDVSCPTVTLAPGESMTCTATVVAPEAGEYTSTANVTGTPTGSDGEPIADLVNGGVVGDVADTDPETATVVPAAITVEKTLNDLERAAVEPGVDIAVEFVVTNTGSAPLVNVTVVDDTINDVTCPTTDLAPGESMTCTAILAGLNAGDVHTNTVDAAGTPVRNGIPDSDVVTAKDSATAWGIAPAITVLKDIAPDGTVTATFTNTGNTPLANVTFSDDIFTTVSDWDCGDFDGTLALDAQAACTLIMPLPENGELHANTFTVTGEASQEDGTPIGEPVSAADDATLYTPASPSLDVEVLVEGDDADTAPGVPVEDGSMTVTYVVTNTGDTSLSSITVTGVDGQPVVMPVDTLAPGETTTATVEMPAPGEGETYAATGVASGTPVLSDGSPAVDTDGTALADVSDTDPINAYTPASPVVGLEVLINGQDADTAAETVGVDDPTMTVTYVVTNDGDTPLTNITVIGIDGQPVTVPVDTLAPGETATVDVVMPAPGEGEAIAVDGSVEATPVTADGDPAVGADGQPLAPVTDTDPINAHNPANPAVDVEVLVNGEDADTLDTLVSTNDPTMTVTYVVTNDGNTPLSSITVVGIDGQLVEIPVDVLAPGETATVDTTMPTPEPGSTLTTDGETEATPVTADGEPAVGADGQPLAPVTDTDPINVHSTPAPSVGLEVLINGQDADTAAETVGVDDPTMTVTYVVTNDGNIPLSSITVTGINGQPVEVPIDVLEPGGEVVVEVEMPAPGEGSSIAPDGAVVATPSLIDGTPAVNEGGQPLAPVGSADPVNAHNPGEPSVSLEVLVAGEDADEQQDAVQAVGDTMTVAYVVTNTGDTPLSSIVVTGVDGQPVTVPVDVLEPGENATVEVVLPAPADGVVYSETGAVEATPVTVDGEPAVGVDGRPLAPVGDDDPINVYSPAEAAVDVVKYVNGEQSEPGAPGVLVEGDTATVTYVVTNTGLAHLADVTVEDPDGNLITEIECEDAVLAPGESMTCTARMATPEPGAVMSSPVTVGALPVTVDGVTPAMGEDGEPLPPVGASDPESVYTPAVTSVTVDVELPPSVTVGERVPLEYVVTNTGTSTLANVVVTDPSTGQPVECPRTVLAPGESMTCTATVVVPSTGSLKADPVVTGVPTLSDGSTPALGHNGTALSSTQGDDAEVVAAKPKKAPVLGLAHTGGVVSAAAWLGAILMGLGVALVAFMRRRVRHNDAS